MPKTTNPFSEENQDISILVTDNEEVRLLKKRERNRRSAARSRARRRDLVDDLKFKVSELEAEKEIMRKEMLALRRALSGQQGVPLLGNSNSPTNSPISDGPSPSAFTVPGTHPSIPVAGGHAMEFSSVSSGGVRSSPPGHERAAAALVSVGTNSSSVDTLIAAAVAANSAPGSRGTSPLPDSHLLMHQGAPQKAAMAMVPTGHPSLAGVHSFNVGGIHYPMNFSASPPAASASPINPMMMGGDPTGMALHGGGSVGIPQLNSLSPVPRMNSMLPILPGNGTQGGVVSPAGAQSPVRSPSPLATGTMLQRGVSMFNTVKQVVQQHLPTYTGIGFAGGNGKAVNEDGHPYVTLGGMMPIGGRMEGSLSLDSLGVGGPMGGRVSGPGGMMGASPPIVAPGSPGNVATPSPTQWG